LVVEKTSGRAWRCISLGFPDGGPDVAHAGAPALTFLMQNKDVAGHVGYLFFFPRGG
jgi:hypothetical protein